MASMEKMEKYMEEWQAGKGDEWRNQLICSWNGVKEKGKTWLDGGELVFLVEQLTELNLAFTTHFKYDDDGKLDINVGAVHGDGGEIREQCCTMARSYSRASEDGGQDDRKAAVHPDGYR